MSDLKTGCQYIGMLPQAITSDILPEGLPGVIFSNEGTFYVLWYVYFSTTVALEQNTNLHCVNMFR